MNEDITNKPLEEITLRLYEKPSGLKGRDLIKKVCLSCGLINPGDTRDIIVEVFWILAKARKTQTWLSSKEIEDQTIQLRKDLELNEEGTAPSNIRRILLILTEYGFIEKIKAKYRFIEFKPLEEIFETISKEKIHKIIERNKEYLRLI